MQSEAAKSPHGICPRCGKLMDRLYFNWQCGHCQFQAEGCRRCWSNGHFLDEATQKVIACPDCQGKGFLGAAEVKS